MRRAAIFGSPMAGAFPYASNAWRLPCALTRWRFPARDSYRIPGAWRCVPRRGRFFLPIPISRDSRCSRRRHGGDIKQRCGSLACVGEIFPRRRVAFSRSRLREAPEKTITLPCRPPRIIGDLHGQTAHDFLEPGRSLEIHRLIGIIRRGMIAIGEPLLEHLFFRRPGLKPHLHRKRWDSLLDEIVLVAADKKIAKRFGVGL